MKINIKARLKNKTFVMTIAVLVISFFYRICCLCGVFPDISEEETKEIVNLMVNILAIAGVVVDPTTKGFSDSERAMGYYAAE